MKKTHRIIALSLALLITVSMAACAASNGEMTVEAPMVDRAPSYEAYDMAEPELYTEDGGAAGFDSPAALSGEISLSPEKIIYSGSAEIETLDFEGTLKKLDALIRECGGFIQSSSVTGTDYYSSVYRSGYSRKAYYEIRIPSDKFASVTGSLDTLGNVPYSSTSAENVSSQYRDAEARLTSYRAQEERYLELLSMADTVEDVLYVEKYLSQIRYEIEALESQIKSWDSSVSYSTLALNITEVIEYTEQEELPVEQSYGEQLGEAFGGTMKGLGNFFKGLFKFLVGASPVLALLAIIIVPVLLVIRARNRRNKTPKSDKTQDE